MMLSMSCNAAIIALKLQCKDGHFSTNHQMLYTSLTSENQRVNNKNKLYGKAGSRAHTAPWHPLFAKDMEWL